MSDFYIPCVYHMASNTDNLFISPVKITLIDFGRVSESPYTRSLNSRLYSVNSIVIRKEGNK